jgi:hypothetical protein
MKRIALVSFLIIALVSFSQAQYGYGGIAYSTSIPTANLNDYISNFSGRGFAVEGHGYISDAVSIGGYYSLNTFYDKSSGTFNRDNVTLTGTQNRYVNASPIAVDFRYHSMDMGISPGFYTGIGVGTMWVEQRTLLGIFESRVVEWQFLIVPQAGYIYPIGSGDAALHLSARYNIASASSDLDGQQYVSINLGFLWY